MSEFFFYMFIILLLSYSLANSIGGIIDGYIIIGVMGCVINLVLIPIFAVTLYNKVYKEG